MKNNLGEDIPDRLYKYMPWRVDEKTGINYTKQLLENNKFYLSPVCKLNDLFECRVIPSIDGNIEAIKKRFKDWSMTLEQKNQIIQDENFRRNLMQLKHKKDLIDVGICSFAGSEHAASLMWSHYADISKGICLIFDTAKLQGNVNKLNILKVNYTEKYPQVSFTHAELWEIVKAKFATKEKCWEYEDEYRMIAVEAAKDYDRKYLFSSESLVEVVLGCNMSPMDQSDCADTLRKRSSSVELYQAVVKEQQFALGKEPISTYGGDSTK